jgi:hypothetical protein
VYCSSGAVFDASTGAHIGQYPARGAVGVLPGADRMAFIDTALQLFGGGSLFGPLVVTRHSTGEFVSSTMLPDVNRGSFIPWGSNGLVYRQPEPQDPLRRLDRKLKIFNLP